MFEKWYQRRFSLKIETGSNHYEIFFACPSFSRTSLFLFNVLSNQAGLTYRKHACEISGLDSIFSFSIGFQLRKPTELIFVRKNIFFRVIKRNFRKYRKTFAYNANKRETFETQNLNFLYIRSYKRDIFIFYQYHFRNESLIICRIWRFGFTNQT